MRIEVFEMAATRGNTTTTTIPTLIPLTGVPDMIPSISTKITTIATTMTETSAVTDMITVNNSSGVWRIRQATKEIDEVGLHMIISLPSESIPDLVIVVVTTIIIITTTTTTTTGLSGMITKRHELLFGACETEIDRAGDVFPIAPVVVVVIVIIAVTIIIHTPMMFIATTYLSVVTVVIAGVVVASEVSIGPDDADSRCHIDRIKRK